MPHDDQVARFAIPHEEYLRRSARKLHAYEEVRRAIAADRTLLIERQHLEPASEIVAAVLTGRPRTLNVTSASQLPDCSATYGLHA